MRRQLKTIETRKLFSVLTVTMTLLMLFQNCGDAFKTLPLEQLNLAASIPKYAVFIASDQNVASKESIQNFTLTVDPARTSEIIAYYCQLDEAAPKLCQPNFELRDLPEKNHRLKVEGKNSAGVTIASGRYDFVVDKTGPVLTFVQAPGAVVGTNTANFTFSTVDALTRASDLKCSLDNGAYAVVPEIHFISNLTEGSHNLKCQASDEVGNLSALVEKTWLTAISAPGIVLASNLPAFTGVTAQVRFTTTTTTAGAVITTCSLDNGAFDTCVTGKSYAGLAAGNHTVVVKAKDQFNRESSAAYTWAVDLTPPVVRLTSTYGLYSNLSSVPLAFVSEDPMGSGGGSCECGLGADSGTAAYGICVSPYAISGAVEGLKTAFVRCKDAIGNLSAAAKFQITVDRTPPTLGYVTDVKFVSSNRDANFTFTVNETISKPARVQSSLNEGAFVDTALTYPLRGLADGRYTLKIRAVDDAGNVSAQQQVSWAVDTLPPEAPQGIRFSSRSSNVTTQWEVAVDTGGIANYEIQVGTQPGLADLVPKTVVSVNSYPVPYDLQSRVVNGVAERVFDTRVVYISVRATDTLGNVGPWGSSGPTNPLLYDSNFSYRPVCGFSGNCHATERLITDEASIDAASLNIGDMKTEVYVGVLPSTLVRIGSSFRNDTLRALIVRSPGSLTSECAINGVNFPCDMVDQGTQLPILNRETDHKIEVTIRYNNEVFFKTSFVAELTPRALQTVANLTNVTATSVLVYGNASYTDVFNPMKQVWVESGGYAHFNYICWTSPTKVETRLVVREGGVLVSKGAVNPFQDCTVKAYVDRGGRFYSGSGVIEELIVQPGAKVFFQTTFGALRPLKISKATQQTIPPIESCPYSPTGACPAGTVTFR